MIQQRSPQLRVEFRQRLFETAESCNELLRRCFCRKHVGDGGGCFIVLLFDGGVALSQIIIPLLVLCLVKGHSRILTYRRLHHVGKKVHFVEQAGLLRFEGSRVV